MTGSSVGIDVGGTFTDFVVRAPSGRLSSGKVPTTPANPALGVMQGLTTLVGSAPLASVAHGTTIVTNAIIEGRGAVVGLISTRGFRDVLEIARVSRLHLYDLKAAPKPPALVPRRLRLEVSERVGPDGAIERALTLDEIAELVATLTREGVESVAVCLLHSYANPEHERTLRAYLERHFRHVCVSSDINAEFREYERSCTTVLNAAVMPLASRYIEQLDQRLGLQAAGATLHLLHSAGGMMSVETARARPPMAAVESIGAGGGSIAYVDAAGALRVGPRSAGAAPGPACYGLGGAEPTVTDANLLLGYLDPERVYGRAIRLDRERARVALDALARRLGLSLLETAAGVIEVANAAMLRALRLVSVQRGYDLRDFTLIAYGGAGPVHAGALAGAAGIARVLVPAHSGAFSALGCLVSPLRYDAVRTYRGLLSAWDAKPADQRLRELQEQCVAPLTDEGIALDRIAVQWSADLRYSGQNYEIEIPWRNTPEALRAEFEARHRRLYGYATGESVECLNLRVVARVPDVAVTLSELEPAGTPGVTGEQRAHFAGLGEVALPRYDRAALAPGCSVLGPALIEDEWSTTLLYPGQRCAADRLGNLVIEVSA